MTKAKRPDVYTRITNRIAAELEQGVRPWLKPWSAENAAGKVVLPLRHNGTPYRGINILMLWEAAMDGGFGCPIWMTYKQARETGGQVRKGERGSKVVYANTFTTEAENTETGEAEEIEVPFLKEYTVFNVEQIDGLPEHYYHKPEAPALPCVVMADGDDAAAIEASLAENTARLPMDPFDQFDAFSRLLKAGRGIEDIASLFGISDRLVRQRLALANLLPKIKTAARNGEIDGEAVRALTLASKKQQQDWLALFTDPDEREPRGLRLKHWLFGAVITTDVALFDVEAFEGEIVSDLFGEERYFADAGAFWDAQFAAIEAEAERLRAEGWAEVVVLDPGTYWHRWEHERVSREDGGRVYVVTRPNGEVEINEGYLTPAEYRRKQREAEGKAPEEGPEAKPERPELTQPLENYIDLHRHAAVGAALTRAAKERAGGHHYALRLAVATMLASTANWSVRVDTTAPMREATAASVTGGRAAKELAEARKAAAELARHLPCPRPAPHRPPRAERDRHGPPVRGSPAPRRRTGSRHPHRDRRRNPARGQRPRRGSRGQA